MDQYIKGQCKWQFIIKMSATPQWLLCQSNIVTWKIQQNVSFLFHGHGFVNAMIYMYVYIYYLQENCEYVVKNPPTVGLTCDFLWYYKAKIFI